MIRLRAVGECVIEVGAGRVGPDAEVAFAVLLVLALARGRPLGRQWLVDLLWPATTEARARHNLRQTIYKLRQMGVPVESHGHQVLLHADQIAPSPLLDEEDEAVQQLLLRPDQPFGEFLAGYTPQVSGAFGLWLDEQRDQANGRLRRAVLSLLLDERRRGNWGTVEMLARKCLQLDPLNEEATLALAEATALTGSKRAALAILDGYVEELGGSGVGAGDLRLPAAVLRKRIAERLHPPTSLAVAESCFVGRGDCMALMGERLQLVRRGSGRALLVWGEAGMGKSRLATEFMQLCILDGVHAVRVVCQARDLDRPLSVFMDVVPMLLELPGALGCSPESMAYLKRLTEHDPDMTEPSEATREAEVLFAGVRQAILDLVDAVAEDAALLLCVEDVHWLDDQSWRVLRELMDWSDTRQVFVLLTSRQPHPTPSPPERPSRSLELLRLGPLGQTDSLVLFESVTSGYGPPTMFRDWCIHVAEGNPFFVRALAIHWMETGELGAPTSLAELIGQRVSRLGDQPLLTLQACAVLGKASSLDRLELVLEHKRHELVESVGVLSEHGLLAVGVEGLPCRHDLIAQSALERLALPSRRLLHRCAAEVLQAEIERSQSATLLWECAQQWQSAGEGERAMALVKSCAGHLLEVGLPADAAEIYEKALELCETDEERLEMLELLKQTLLVSGRWAGVRDAIGAIAVIRYGAADRRGAEDDNAILHAEALWRLGMSDQDALLDVRTRVLNRDLRPLHRVKAAALALTIADNACDVSTFKECFVAAQPLLHAPGVPPFAATQLELMYHTSQGELDLAVARARHIVAAGSPQHDVGTLAKLYRFASLPLRRAGRFTEAEQALRLALDVAEKRNLIAAQLNAIESVVLLKLEQMATAEADVWYRHSLRVLGDHKEVDPTTILSLQSLGARIAFAEGDHETAFQRFAMIGMHGEQEAVARKRAGLLALEAVLAPANNQQRSNTVRHLAATLERTQSWGGQDFNFAALGMALRELGRAPEGRTILARYLADFRRERFPVPAWLFQALE